MRIIIPMAGLGSRFKDIGLTKPKHELIANNKTLFEWSILSLSNFFDENFIFIARKNGYNLKFINEKLQNLGVMNYDIVEIDQLTDGQASTCMTADHLIRDDEEILIYNIDTYISNSVINKRDFVDYSGFLHVFEGEGDKWSFIKTNSEGKVILVTEKKRVSNLCSVGTYYFNEWSTFKSIYLNNKEEIKLKYNEVYVAPMYQYLIKVGEEVGYKTLESTDVHILGTPADVIDFDSDFLVTNQ